MDKLEVKIIAWTGLILMTFLVSLLYAANNRKIDVPTCVPYTGAFKESYFKQIDSNSYELFIVAKMWAFEPNEIYIPVGSEVDIYLTSKDVVHGCHIEKKGINLMAVPGGINMIRTKFDRPGIYKIVCHEYCGAGHQNMQSEIVVN